MAGVLDAGDPLGSGAVSLTNIYNSSDHIHPVGIAVSFKGRKFLNSLTVSDLLRVY